MYNPLPFDTNILTATYPFIMEKLKYESQIKVLSKCDVLVVGSGSAGIAASVSASRAGAKVILLERYGAHLVEILPSEV